MKGIALHWQILIALVLAIPFGLFASDYAVYVTWMGDVFLRGLKMIIVPLILSSIISGITNLGSGDSLGRLGLKTLVYYLSTSFLAIVTGLLFVNLLQPGVGAPKQPGTDTSMLEKASQTSFGDTLMEMIPTNVFAALSAGNMLAIIFFAILFGFFTTRVEEKYSRLLTDFFNAVFEVMMKITMFIILFTPFGVFGLVVDTVAEQAGDAEALAAMAGSLGIYMLTVALALTTHFFLSLPLIVYVFARVNPYQHLRNMATPLLTAFSTSSSSATLPLTMEAVEHKSGVSNKISSFTLPLGATVNMDGTALYECVAALFIAQAYGVELSLGQQVLVVFTALLASIGAAGIPMAGLVMISVVLTAVDLPLEGVGMILAVDRVLDMMRTATNVWSDTCGAVLVAKSEGEVLKLS
ncbi:MAG: dicarboxylate/amino acid:cation symporter [Microscillaceae bacterium]